jgi:molybdopterin-guanine dinucleotide biosynthesis protein A
LENKQHQKHAKMPRAHAGEWARNELALLGAPCGVIQELARKIAARLAKQWKVGFADADHHAEDEVQEINEASIIYTDKIHSRQVTMQKDLNAFERRALFNDQDLMLVNGNHFTAQSQIVIIDEAKPLEKKLDRLTDVVLILLKNKEAVIPGYLQQAVAGFDAVPRLYLDQTEALVAFMNHYLERKIPMVNGLVLAGGKSVRMGTDKGLLQYHGAAQREHVYGLLQSVCKDVYLSCNAGQFAEAPAGMNKLQDAFLGLGPMGGILTAMQSAPDCAWLAVACDLPYLDDATLQYLYEHRDPSKFATAFMNEEQGFPEPMITLWEPRSYPLLLQFLGMGYSCPRKVLINSAIALLQVPDKKMLENINEPQGYQEAFKKLNHE